MMVGIWFLYTYFLLLIGYTLNFNFIYYLAYDIVVGELYFYWVYITKFATIFHQIKKATEMNPLPVYFIYDDILF